jgi:hypothetical protein
MDPRDLDRLQTLREEGLMREGVFGLPIISPLFDWDLYKEFHC